MCHVFRSGLICASTLFAALVLGGRGVRGQTPWYEGFEGGEPSWRPAGSDAHFRVLLHERVQNEAFTGEACERLAISAAGGTYVYFGHDVGRASVIDELLPSVRIKSDRGGLQILARVVLPRTTDPQTGQPLSTLVRGSSYTTVGHWDQLRVDGVPQRLARQTRVLRARLGPHVDPREAYVDCILLNVYGGPSVTNVWIDDLDIGGYVESQPAGRNATAGEPSADRAVSPRLASTAGLIGRSSAGPGSRAARRIELDGSVLLADGQRLFPRVIQYQGEPLELLKRLGFNAVWLEQLPGPEILDEAARLGLWLVCPPPRPTQPAAPNGIGISLSPIGAEYDRVLAWDLGQGLSGQDLAATKRWAEQVSAADRERGRPLICRPHSDLRKYSRYDVDLLLIGRSPLGSSLELADYGEWLRQRPRLARPGTPIWTTVQTQPDPRLYAQWSGLAQGGSPPPAVSSEQIRLLVYLAIHAGSRGLLFESHSSLEAADADTQRRALALELLNLELVMIEPWLTGGSFVTTIRAREPHVVGAVLRTDRARLLVPIWLAPGAQFVSGQSAANDVSFVVPGVPESNNAYLLIPGALKRLRSERVTGGTRVTLDEFGLTSLVLFTQDALVISRVSQRAAQIRRRAAQLQRDLAVARLQAVEQVLRRWSAGTAGRPQAAGRLALAREGIQWADRFLASPDYPNAYQHAQRAMRPLRILEREYWEAAVGLLPSAVSSPAAVSFATLPWHWELMHQMGRSQPGPNALAGGEFEDPGMTLQAGWQHFHHPAPGIHAEAELAARAARSGRYGLRLVARAAEGDQWQGLVEVPPSWIRSPAVPVEAGQWVLIRGWVQVPEPITGSVDGLLIIDSLSDEPLAERVHRTDGWQQFTLYRLATQRAYVTVTFALSGLGEAWVDDVTIQKIPPDGSPSTSPDVAHRSGVSRQ